jgi:hypothetical protein
MAEAMLKGPSEDNSREIVPILNGYFQEADNARKGGPHQRDMKWQENLDLYWNRYDHTAKASWQAKENLPTVPSYVDRFAAALKEALVASPNSFYDVIDPAGVEDGLSLAVKRMTDVWLSMVGRNQTGTCLGFPAVFEEQMKLGALMACSSVTTWKTDMKYGRVAIETVDPRNVWLDPTYRNLYRIRRVELDKHSLRAMALQKDGKGNAIFNLGAIDQMVTHIEQQAQQDREMLTGHGGMMTSTRQPIMMDEYIATVVDHSGRVLAKDALMVVGNDQFLIRGPEPNPYWHKKDWLTFAPLVTVPLSVYGRSYMEDFGGVSRTFNAMTNLLLDAVLMSSMKAYAVVPSMLLDPGQLAGGITANKLFHLEDGARAEDFLNAVDLGNLKPESFQMWTSLKNEITEAAGQNEISLGQFAPKGRTSATEISETKESSSAIIRSVAQTIETRWLDVTLDLVWQTGLQHMSTADPMLRKACGEDLFGELMDRRKELASSGITFQAHGISSLIQKNRMLKALLQLMAFMSQSPELLAAFMQEVDLQKFLRLLFRLSDIDITKLTMTEQEKQMKALADQMAAAQAMQGGMPAPGQAPAEGLPGQAQDMQQITQALGVGR